MGYSLTEHVLLNMHKVCPNCNQREAMYLMKWKTEKCSVCEFCGFYITYNPDSTPKNVNFPKI